MAIMNLSKRQNNDDDFYDYGWWYSPTAYAVKWAVVSSLVVLFLLFLVIGHIHARRRMKRGQPPLSYHRWLVSKRKKQAFAEQYPQYRAQLGLHPPGVSRVVYTPSGPAYPMHNYGPPPPAYHEPDYVPAYAPPQGSTKVDPDQNYTAPPPGGPGYSGYGGPSQPERAADPYHR